MAQDDTQKGNTVEGEWREPAEQSSDALADLTPPRAEPRRRIKIFVSLAFIIAVACIGFLGWQQLQTLKAEQTGKHNQLTTLATQVAKLESALTSLKTNTQKHTDAQRELDQTVQRIQSQQAQHNEIQGQALTALQNSFAEWAARSGAEHMGWQLAEAEWLLWLGNQRLQQQRHFSGAISALSAADAMLQQLNHPRLRAVREQLANETLALKTAEKPDIDHIALSLLAISNQAAQLPLPARPKPDGAVQKPPAETKDNSSFKTALTNLWQELRSLVVIRRQEKNLQPWLSDREEQLIYQGLQVRLDAARLAALRGNGNLYQQSVYSAQHWLKTWFDDQTTAVSAVNAELQALSQQHLEPAIPDISASLIMLRELRQAGIK